MAKKKSSKKHSSAKVPITKYFQLVDPPIHMYSRAYLGEQYRGIMKSVEAWDEELDRYKYS